MKRLQRKLKVQELLLNGYSQEKIAEKLNISTSTVYRDVKEFRESNEEWLEDLATKNFVITFRETLDGLKQDMVRLNELLEDKAIQNNKELQVKIIRNIFEIRVKYTQLLGSFPVVWSIDKWIQKNNPVSISNHNLPVLSNSR